VGGTRELWSSQLKLAINKFNEIMDQIRGIQLKNEKEDWEEYIHMY